MLRASCVRASQGRSDLLNLLSHSINNRAVHIIWYQSRSFLGLIPIRYRRHIPLPRRAAKSTANVRRWRQHAGHSSLHGRFDKLVKMVGDLGKRMDGEISSVRQEASLISASVKNVQTQLLDKQGRFDTHDASSSGPPSVPGHKLRFPKYDGSDDPITWLHKGEQFFRAYGTPDHLKVPTASFYLEAAASQWYYRLEQNQGVPTWPQFESVIQIGRAHV